MSDPTTWTAGETVAAIARGDVSAREATQAALDRIGALDPRLHAFLTVAADPALADADAIDARRASGDPLPPLAGVPIAVKDNICTRGVRTTAGSRSLHNFVPPYDATVIERLRAAGAVVIGKTNCDEFGMGSSTENSAYYPTVNPWALDRVPGGSSGGSAAAVAGMEAPLALGSDTGGSIRQPASFCGVVGMKPTYGRVSRYGLIAFASSLDQIGPLARSTRDCALMLTAVAGHDPCDSTSAPLRPPDFTQACREGLHGLRIGVPREFFGAGVAHGVAAAVRCAIDQLMALGATAEECSLPYAEYALAAYYIVAPAEASSNLARFDGVRYGLRTSEMAGHIGLTEKTRGEGFGAEVKQRIMIGTYALSAGYYDAYYRRAQQVRTLIRRDFDRAFETFDVLATPTAPTTAYRLCENADPLQMKLGDVCTLPASLAGIPGMSVPCGFVAGLPVGMQLLGRPFAEETLLRVAYSYEQATNWHAALPPVDAG